jgi:hypothetical protein
MDASYPPAARAPYVSRAALSCACTARPSRRPRPPVAPARRARLPPVVPVRARTRADGPPHRAPTDPLIAEGLALKEAFGDVERAGDRADAEQRLDAFLAAVARAGPPAFAAVAKASAAGARSCWPASMSRPPTSTPKASSSRSRSFKRRAYGIPTFTAFRQRVLDELSSRGHAFLRRPHAFERGERSESRPSPSGDRRQGPGEPIALPTTLVDSSSTGRRARRRGRSRRGCSGRRLHGSAASGAARDRVLGHAVALADGGRSQGREVARRTSSVLSTPPARRSGHGFLPHAT